jgi:hypothetical protein
MPVLFLKYGRPVLRQGWPALGLLFVLPGVFGGGVLTNAFETSRANGINMTAEYESAVHLHTPTTITLSITSIFRNTGQFSIRVENKLSEHFSISQIDPQPFLTRVDKSGTVYFFSAIKNNTLIFTLIPEAIGRSAVTLQYNVDTPVAFSITTIL